MFRNTIFTGQYLDRSLPRSRDRGIDRRTGQYPISAYTTWRNLNQSQPHISIRGIIIVVVVVVADNVVVSTKKAQLLDIVTTAKFPCTTLLNTLQHCTPSCGYPHEAYYLYRNKIYQFNRTIILYSAPQNAHSKHSLSYYNGNKH